MSQPEPTGLASIGEAIARSRKRSESLSFRVFLVTLLLVGAAAGSACTAANKFLNYPTRAFREATGQKSREHRIVPIQESLAKYKKLEVMPVDNLVGDQIPPQLVDRLNASLYRQLASRREFPVVVRVQEQQSESSDQAFDEAPQATAAEATVGSAGTKAETNDTLVLESYIDNYHPGNKFLRLVEVGVRQAYITLRYRLKDKLTGTVIGAGSVTVDDFRSLATKAGIINKATREVAKQLRPVDPSELEKIQKIARAREAVEQAQPSEPVVVESECSNAPPDRMVHSLVEDNYKPHRENVSLKGELLGGEFRVVTVIPFAGDFSKYRRIEIPRLQSLIGPDVPETMLEKYTKEVQTGFAKTCRFDEVMASREYDPSAKLSETKAANPSEESHPARTVESITDIEPLDAPMLSAADMAVKDAQRITRQQASADQKPSEKDTLVVFGEVIDFAPGNRALQLLAPLNLGSSVLSVRLSYYDKKSGELVGRQVVTGITEGRMLAGPLGIRTALTAVSEGIVDQVTRRTLAGER